VEDQQQRQRRNQQQNQQQDRGRGTPPASPPPPPPPPPPAPGASPPPPPPAATTTPPGGQPRQGGRDNRNQPPGGTQPGAQGGTTPGAQGGTAGDRRNAPLTRAGTPAPTAADTRPIASQGAGKSVTVQSSSGQEIRRVDQLRSERREVKEGNRTIIREPDRTIIREGNRTIIRHDEGDRFRLGARDVRIERAGNDTRTVVIRPGGESIVTVTDRNGFLLRRSRFLANGREVIIIDNRPRPGVVVGNFFVVLPPPVIRIPRERYIVAYRDAPPALIYETLTAPPVDRIERAYSLDEIRYSPSVRDRMPRVDLNTVHFESGSWDLAPEEVNKLGPVAEAMKRAIEQNPQTVFMIEGHTDKVGNEEDNLSLSDRRAEAVAVAITEQFQVPPENLTTQGYGEQQPIEQTDGPSETNRRVTVRNISPLLMGRNDQGGPPQQQQPQPQ
jgi:OmpA-OmpF porin, OOP family